MPTRAWLNTSLNADSPTGWLLDTMIAEDDELPIFG